MRERLLQLDNVRDTDSPEKVANLFQLLGYNILLTAQPLSVKDLELPARSTEAIWDAHLIADHSRGAHSLQVLLFQLAGTEWETPIAASSRMRSIAQSLSRRPSNFLLLGTKNYDQLMLVNPRKSLDAQGNLKVGIRKLLIDRTKPTNYDRDRLEAIAAHNLDPQSLYKKQCEAFDVEKLTKEFYKGYKEIFEQVQRVICENNPHPYFDDASRLHQFSQRLLGRVMFLYFLQKKEFLGGDRDFLKNQYHKLKPEAEDTEFYTTLLEPLFFEILNKERPNFESPWGKIPYLNGGLFDQDYGDDVVDTEGFQTPNQLILPNSLFDPSGEKGVLKFFNGYNFTVSENVQGDEDVAVDPEMLGKVFENMLAADERGKSGTFYTPREIVHFMCVESLSRYLADESGIDLEVVKQLAEYETEMPDADLKKLLSKDQTRKLKQALETVKVCDPAVGSGAFPLGMMQVILSVWQVIGQREGESIKRGSLAMSRLKRKIIANNLYGVDIKPEAIEIAKLRMWLSMVVDIPMIDDVEPLPNLDYKLMAGNSLISTIAGEHLIPDPTKTQQGMLNVTPVQAAIQPLLNLQHQYFESHSEDRKGLSKQIREAEATVFRAAISDRRQYWQGEQRKLEQNINRMGKASKAETQKLQTFGDKLKELETIEIDVTRGLRSLDFFQWHLHFNDVFQEKGGFDVVIGNPPYVFARNSKEKGLTEQNKKYLYDNFQLAEYQINLYPLFIEQGHYLLRDKALLCYLTPNNWLTINTNKKLRKFILDQSDVKIVNFYAQVFETAAVDSSIVAYKKGVDNQDVTLLEFTGEFVLVKQCKSDYFLQQKDYLINIESLKNFQVSSLIEKIESRSTTLDSLADVKVGLGAYGIGKGTPPQTEEMIKQRVYHSKHKETIEHIKYLEGSDVGRYSLSWSGEYLKYGKHLREPRKNFDLFSARRILVRQIPSKPPYCINACLAEETLLNDRNSMNVINIQEVPELILAILNSKLISYWFVHKFGKMQRGTFPQFKTNELAIFPIPKIFGENREILMEKANQIMDTKCTKEVRTLSDEIDQIVYALYDLTHQEISQIEGGK